MKALPRIIRRSPCAWPAVIAALTLAVAGCATDLPRRFHSHVDYLASDELEGRGIGSHGIELAAEYIGDRFAQLGLEPTGDEGTYFQTFTMTLHRTLTDAGRLAFDGDPIERKQGRDFIPFNFSSDEAFEGEVVFCGYGIMAPDRNHEDFEGVDVSGKVALMLRGEPASWADENGDATRHAMFRSKAYDAKDRDAVAVLIVNQSPAEDESDELLEFEAQGAEAYGIPAFHITREMAEAQLTKAGLASLAELQERLDGGATVSAELPGVRVSGQAGLERKSAPVHNVLGILRGEGPLADEFVVVGAHYDHLGVQKPMMRTFKAGKLVQQSTGPEIHNGADDNASGVSGVIETARMFAEGPPPKRSILFIAFTGEESGVHGSKHYIDHAVVPPDKTVAMLNMDMIGRMKPDESRVQVFGTGCGTGFMEILEEGGRSVGLEIAPIEYPGGNSDHGPFVRKDIPSLHFFTGHHADFHKPSDDADKINAEGGAKVVSLVYHVARELATRDERPTFQVVKKGKGDEERGPAPSYRVVMGIAPGFTEDDLPGMAADSVNPDGPADLAGMKAGDRIIRIGGKEIANIYDYMAALRNNKPGDTVEVVVLRDGQETTLQVTLASAR